MFKVVTNIIGQWHTNINGSPFGTSVLDKEFETADKTSLILYNGDNKWSLNKESGINITDKYGPKMIVRLQSGIRFRVTDTFKCSNMVEGISNKIYIKIIEDPILCHDESPAIEKYNKIGPDEETHTFKEKINGKDWIFYNNFDRTLALKGKIVNGKLKMKDKIVKLNYRDFFNDQDGAQLDYYHKNQDSMLNKNELLK